MEKREVKKIADNITHWKQLRNSEFVGSWDLPADGKAVKVTISELNLENVAIPPSFKKEWTHVLSFKDKPKRMFLKPTNMAAIASWHGDDPKGWIGKEISIFRTTTKMNGETVECIRVPKNAKRVIQDKSNAATEAAQ